MATPIAPQELYQRLQAGEAITLIDIRFAQIGQIPGSIHVPVTDLEDQAWDWDPQSELVVFCQYGRGASDYAAEVLEEQGYAHVRTLQGGMDAYVAFLAGASS